MKHGGRAGTCTVSEFSYAFEEYACGAARDRSRASAWVEPEAFGLACEAEPLGVQDGPHRPAVGLDPMLGQLAANPRRVKASLDLTRALSQSAFSPTSTRSLRPPIFPGATERVSRSRIDHFDTAEGAISSASLT